MKREKNWNAKEGKGNDRSSSDAHLNHSYLQLTPSQFFLPKQEQGICSVVVDVVYSVVEVDNTLKCGQDLEFVVNGKCGGSRQAVLQCQPCHGFSWNSLLVHFCF